MVAGSIAIPTASAQERYTSLTYNGQINLTFEEQFTQYITRSYSTQLTFTLTLDRPFGSNDLNGHVTAKGTISGATTDASPFSGCASSYQTTGTYTTTVSGITSLQAGTIDLAGGSPSNEVLTTSPVIPPGYGCNSGYGGSLREILISCFSSSTQSVVTNRGCDKFPIQGGSQTIAKGSSSYFKSISGTIVLTLVDSKIEESFDFAVDVTPPEIKVFNGGTAIYDVSVSTIKGKASQVTLSAPLVEGLERPVLSRTTGTPPFNAKLTVPAGEAKPGKYTLQVTGTTGDATRTSKIVTLVVEDCPLFTITPTMPAAGDPREFAPSNGRASFRFDIEWNGKLPVSIALNAVAAGGGVVQPDFVFNPVQMLNNKVNIIMDVTTVNAGEGNYPIIVTVTVNGPELPIGCAVTTTAVTLVVGESRPQDFPLIIRPIQIINQQGPVVVQGKQIETQDNGTAKVAIANGTLDIANNSKVNIIRPNRTADGQNVNAGPMINDVLDEELDKEIMDELREKSLKILEQAEIDRQKAAAQKDLIDILACMFVFDPEIARSCLGFDVVYVYRGEVHVFDISKEKRLQEAEVEDLVILAPDAVMIPKGTEFILKIDDDGNTVLTMIDGSVLYTQLSTQNMTLVNATQQLTAEVQPAAGGQSVSGSISSIDANNIERWWLQGNRTTTTLTTTTSATTTTTTSNSTKTLSSTTLTTITSSYNTTKTTTTTTSSTSTSTAPSTSTSSTTTIVSASTQVDSSGTIDSAQATDFNLIAVAAAFIVAIIGVLAVVLLKRRR